MKNIRPSPVKIGCCVCLNIKGQRVAASTVVAGYAVCDEHIELAGRPDFSIWHLTTYRGQV